MTAEGSSIAQVINSFGRSLDLAEEGSLHAVEALTKTMDTFGFYRQAFADSDSPLVQGASRRTTEAMELIREGSSALELAKKTMRDFSKEIAPSLALADSSQTRSTPSGEQILDTSRRPRSLRSLAATVTREGESGADLINKTRATVEGVVDLFNPPGPSGLSTSTNPPAVAPSQPASTPGGGDPVLTAVVVVAAGLKLAQLAVGFIKRKIAGGFST